MSAVPPAPSVTTPPVPAGIRPETIELALSILSPIVLLAVWEIASMFGWVNTQFFPAPSSILRRRFRSHTRYLPMAFGQIEPFVPPLLPPRAGRAILASGPVPLGTGTRAPDRGR